MKKSGLADSPFFLKPAEEQQVNPKQEVELYQRTEFRTENRSEMRTAPLPPVPEKRKTTRYSFEFYDDQIMKLKQLKYQAEMAGKRVNLSDFAREAFDQYLQEKDL